MGTQIRAFAVALALTFACLTPISVMAQSGLASVQDSIRELDKWLGDGANGKKWGEYLSLPALRAELAKGDKADPAAIAALQKKLKSGAAGLELGPFEKLRAALDQWTGELAIAHAPNLPEAAVQAESTFRPITDADLAADKSALQAAVAKLDRYLQSGGANGKAWREYLRWNDLDSQLKAEKTDLDALKLVAQRFSADQRGLELPVFTDVSKVLARYSKDLAASKTDQKGEFVTQLKGLAEDLKQYEAGPNDELATEPRRKAGVAGRHAANRSVDPRDSSAVLTTESACSSFASSRRRWHRDGLWMKSPRSKT